MIFQWIKKPTATVASSFPCPDVFCFINAGCPHLDEICQPYICIIDLNASME